MGYIIESICSKENVITIYYKNDLKEEYVDLVL